MDIISTVKNKINALYQGLYSYPSALQIGITYKCNLQCLMCSRSYAINNSEEPLAQEMSFEDFKKIVDGNLRLKKINFTGLGENILHNDFLKMIDYAKNKNIYVMFYDNFFFLDKEMTKKLIDLKVDEIWASIDGATKETYEKIRVGSNFERIIDNIKSFVAIRGGKGSVFPSLNFVYTVNKYNFEEIIEFIKLVKSLVKNYRTTILFKRTIESKDAQEKERLYEEVPAKIIKEAILEAKKPNINLMWENIPTIKDPITKCNYWLMPLISPEGYVFPCCFLYPADNKFSFGNIFLQNNKEIWEGEKCKNFKKLLKNHRTPSACKNCRRYRQN